MSVRNTIKILTLAGAATAMLPGVAAAANPTFGSWSATTGVIGGVTDCPTLFVCEITLSELGFRQATVTEIADPSNVFVQTIVTDTDASGAAGSLEFSDENFVKTDGVSNGILARQNANDGVFLGSVEVRTGWALTAGDPSIDISQDFSEDPDGTAGTGDEFSNAFGIQVNLDAGGSQTGRSMTISQSVGLGSSADKQNFLIEQRSGDLSVDAGTMTLVNTATGGTVDWIAGEDIMLAWIGQTVDIGAGGSSLFGFESIENTTAGANLGSASTFSTTATGGEDVAPADGAGDFASPFDWDTTTFGTAPTI